MMGNVGVRRIRPILLVAIIASIAAIVAIAWPKNEEPVYRGKKLGEWLNVYCRPMHKGDNKREAEDAVRQIGTNAIPWVLKWIGKHPPAWSRAVGDLRASWSPANRVINALQKRPLQISQKRWDAAIAFQILGPSAINAVPALANMLDDDNPGRHWPLDRWPPPAYALSQIGDAGIKPLLDWVSDPRSLARNEQGVTSTIQCLGQVAGNGTNSDRIVSILVEGMRSSNQGVAFSSALALSGMELDPSTVVETLRIAARAGNVSSVRIFLQFLGPKGLAQPRVKEILLQLQDDPDPTIQNEVRAALLRIALETSRTNAASAAQK
jgi:hypothetical protein